MKYPRNYESLKADRIFFLLDTVEKISTGEAYLLAEIYIDNQIIERQDQIEMLGIMNPEVAV